MELLQAQKPAPFMFTKENASHWSKIGAQASVKAREQLKLDALKARSLTPSAERLSKLLVRIELLMEQTKDADKLASLVATHAKLVKSFALLNPRKKRGFGSGTDSSFDAVPLPSQP